VTLTGNLDAAATITVSGIPAAVPPYGIPLATSGYTALNNAAAFSTVVDVFDALGAQHTLTTFFFKDASTANHYIARVYADASEVSPAGTKGTPVQVGSDFSMQFSGSGTITSSPSQTMAINWATGAGASSIKYDLTGFTQFAGGSTINGINQDGKGIGTVTSLNIEKNGDIFALLSNGQSSIIGTLGLANFANVEGLTRSGEQLLQQSQASGEPIIGKPQTGTYGAIQSGSLELSTVDIANEFVKLITLQRGFQANSRIITTINQLLNDIIQLA
jgi:flagellar hook protein FlgE